MTSYRDAVVAFIRRWYFSLPLATSVLALVVCILHVLAMVLPLDPPLFELVCLSPQKWLLHSESFTDGLINSYRLFTYSFFHSGILPLLMNLVGFIPLGSLFERQVGTVQFVHLSVVMAAVNGVCYTLLMVPFMLIVPKWSEACFSGLSSLVMIYISLEANRKSGVFQTRRWFGVPVPGAIYPWFLLIATQIIFPQSAFFGNLSGILVGIIYSLGYLNPLHFPFWVITWIESLWIMSPLCSLESYVQLPGKIVLPTFYDDLDDLDELAAEPAAQPSWLQRARTGFGLWPNQPRYQSLG
ncbi:uncharacterized protein BJ171DRAFT_598103 [Polychytrium aggregatum]|uniref:uncharacterized protein n=1 Tax=Polychytrium aggregatum TaxID=110093 RepID=UPI0022FDB177|nr:uncharacterized protein BJ171DRAFT_598103 [Polychytrium aggregatum]KAI9205916.1 hypothetical protein BJ171DRAFT_598103 [Polychytrium aggregatum]